MSVANVLPHDREAEEHVLGALLLPAANIAADVAETIRPEHFYLRKHQLIYQAALQLHARGEPIDPVTLYDELDRNGHADTIGGRGRVGELAAITPAAGNAVHYARIIRDNHARRQLIAAGQNIARSGWEPSGPVDHMIDQAERELVRLSVSETTGDLVHVSEGLDRTFDTLKRPGGEVTGTPTGLGDLDTLTGGFHPGQLIVIAARPGMGKSALVINQALHVAVTKRRPVAVFSFEMSKTELDLRLLSQLSGVNLHTLRTRIPAFTQHQWDQLEQARDLLAQSPIYIDDTASATLTDIRSRCRRRKAASPNLALVATDYLQLMLGDDKQETRNLEVAALSRGLKVLARELDVPVVTLAQLNRGVEYRHDKRPMLADLRDSGAIEQDADLVVFIYRDGYYTKEDDTVAELIVAKHRNGPTGAPTVRWEKTTAEFQNLARQP